MIIKPPIQESMFESPGVLSKVWVKFFGEIEKIISGNVDDIAEVEETIEEEVEAIDTELLALSTNMNMLKSTPEISTTLEDDDNILTLYWMGV